MPIRILVSEKEPWGGRMNSWAKVMNVGSKKGFEFWGFFNSMTVYKNGQYVATITSLKQLKALILNQ